MFFRHKYYTTSTKSSDFFRQARKQARASALPVNNEKFISADRVFGRPDINTYTITFNVTGTTTKTYKVKGVYGQASTLTVTFKEDGSAEIAGQKYITNNTTYGNIWFCPVDLTNNTYSLTDPVVCSRDEQGNWSMGAWALVVNHTTDKGYNGKVLFVSEKSDWLVPNMTASFTTTDASGGSPTSEQSTALRSRMNQTHWQVRPAIFSMPHCPAWYGHLRKTSVSPTEWLHPTTTARDDSKSNCPMTVKSSSSSMSQSPDCPA